jgi:Flp pilus assembly protein TadG
MVNAALTTFRNPLLTAMVVDRARPKQAEKAATRMIHRLTPIITVTQWLSRLRSDSRGASMVEFALVLPVLGFFLLGTIDVTRAVIAKFTLEQAAQRTIEQVSLGNRNRATYQFLQAQAAANAGIPVGQVVVTEWLECRNSTTGARTTLLFTETCPSGTTSARFVEIAMWQRYMPSFTYPGGRRLAGLQADGSIRVEADAGVRVQ